MFTRCEGGAALGKMSLDPKKTDLLKEETEMRPQVSKDMFARALADMGHNPDEYEGQRLSLKGMCDLYDLNQDAVIDAIDLKHIHAHYDYKNDTIWVDALEAAHFYYCVQSTNALFNPTGT